MKFHLGRRPNEEIYEAVIVELDGPPMAFFEIPLDYWATTNAELEAEGHPEASRLVQRIEYQDFDVETPVHVRAITDRVAARLREVGGGYIWWRRRPTNTEEKRWWLRLGTSPSLPASWWSALSADVRNAAHD